ncbi:c-type cytochrome [Oceaniglobus trochenteri]|uniref:c-type cytochrome n=1 Tax=Oceaniglobus trochenteri TaxID=2763260 RepID=UPI001CFFCCFC|nr:cytochrome c [Oceaniglobus trochenteri]
MKRLTTALIALGLASTAAVAYADAHADAVKARMELMKTIGAQTKILGTNAKGDFDAEAVQAAATKLHEAAMMIPEAFEANETNDESEALPKIWEDFEGFTAKAEGLQEASMAAMDVTDAAALGAAMGDIGGACKACHSEYRAQK